MHGLIWLTIWDFRAAVRVTRVTHHLGLIVLCDVVILSEVARCRAGREAVTDWIKATGTR